MRLLDIKKGDKVVLIPWFHDGEKINCIWEGETTKPTNSHSHYYILYEIETSNRIMAVAESWCEPYVDED